MQSRSQNLVAPVLVVCCIVGLATGSSTAREGAKADSQMFPIYSTVDDQIEASVAFNPVSDQYLVVWANVSSNIDPIIGVRVAAGGYQIGNSFTISSGTGDSSYPDICYNPVANQFLVVWEYDEGVRPDIHSRAVSATGQLLNTEQDLGSGAGLTSRTRPAIAYASVSQKYLVVFESFTQGNVAGDIEAQVLTNGGLLDGINLRIQTGTFSAHHSFPDVAYNRSRNEYLAVWQSDVGDFDVLGRRIQGVGTPMSPETITVSASAWDETMPAVAAMPTTSNFGYYLVVSRIETPSGTSDLWGARVTGQGAAQPGFYVTNDPVLQIRPAVAASEATDQFLVLWTEPVGALGAVMGQRITLDGVQAGPASLYNADNADNGAAAAGAGDDFLVAFDALVWPAVSGRDIFGRIADSEIFSDGFESGNTNAW